jgi:hypothetical protein
MVGLFGTPELVLAKPHVSLDPAPDGTLTLVGRGWRAGQRMVVSGGRGGSLLRNMQRHPANMKTP